MPFIDKSTHWVIRLALRGCTNRPFYHIVVMRNREPRDAGVTDQIGTYDPLPNLMNEKLVAIDYDKLTNWLSKGARPSLPVLQLLGLSGFFPIHPVTRLKAHREQVKADDKNKEETEPVEATS